MSSLIDTQQIKKKVYPKCKTPGATILMQLVHTVHHPRRPSTQGPVEKGSTESGKETKRSSAKRAALFPRLYFWMWLFRNNYFKDFQTRGLAWFRPHCFRQKGSAIVWSFTAWRVLILRFGFAGLLVIFQLASRWGGVSHGGGGGGPDLLNFFRLRSMGPRRRTGRVLIGLRDAAFQGWHRLLRF